MQWILWSRMNRKLHINNPVLFLYIPRSCWNKCYRTPLVQQEIFKLMNHSNVRSRSTWENKWKPLSTSPVRNTNKYLITTNAIILYFRERLLTVTSVSSTYHIYWSKIGTIHSFFFLSFPVEPSNKLHVWYTMYMLWRNRNLKNHKIKITNYN
jgi:hypothetical protein